MVRWIGVLALLVTAEASAQTVMDGSDKAVDEKDISALRKSMGEYLFDPYGAQLDSLRIVETAKLCGRVNARNKKGAFVGFRLFGFSAADGRLAIAPDDAEIPDIRENMNSDEQEKLKMQLEQILDDLKYVKALCAR